MAPPVALEPPKLPEQRKIHISKHISNWVLHVHLFDFLSHMVHPTHQDPEQTICHNQSYSQIQGIAALGRPSKSPFIVITNYKIL